MLEEVYSLHKRFQIVKISIRIITLYVYSYCSKKITETYSSLAPSFDFPSLVTFSSFSTLAQCLHPYILDSSLTTSSSSITLISTEPSTLVWWFLNPCRVHQMKSTFIFIMIICIMGGRTKCRSILV